MSKVKHFFQQSWLLIVASFFFGLLIAVTNAGWSGRILQNEIDKRNHLMRALIADVNSFDVAVEAAEIPFNILDKRVETTSGQVSICTMHLAKGLEFRAVAVMACDDEVIPLQERIETVTDDSGKAVFKDLYPNRDAYLFTVTKKGLPSPPSQKLL